MKALDEFKAYQSAKQLLEEAIESVIRYDIELNTKDKYPFSGHDLRWKMEDDEFIYGEEANLVKEFEDCEMYLVHSCTGDKYIAVFDKANKVAEY